jgi:hypothetical protein
MWLLLLLWLRAAAVHCCLQAAPRWVHIDTGAWVSGSFTGPGRPEGGEALGLRALWRYLDQRYGKKKGAEPADSSSSMSMQQ